MATISVSLRHKHAPKIAIWRLNNFPFPKKEASWRLQIWEVGCDDVNVYNLTEEDLRQIASEIEQALAGKSGVEEE